MKKLFLVLLLSAFLAACQEDADVDQLGSGNSSMPKGVWKKGYYMGNLIDYQEVDGMKLFGDIILRDDEILEITEDMIQTKGVGVRPDVIYPNTRTFCTWPNATVHYIFFDNPNFEPIPEGKKIGVRQAIEHIEANTAIRFIEGESPNGSNQTLKIMCQPGSSPSATIGYGCSGFNSLNIGNNGFTGAMIHEFGHVLGIKHEHERFDRDDYITVHWNNFSTIYYSQFQIPNSAYYKDYGLFDFNSIMLYSSTAFTFRQDKPSMSKKDGSTFVAQRNGLSEWDKYTLAEIYGYEPPFKYAVRVYLHYFLPPFYYQGPFNFKNIVEPRFRDITIYTGPNRKEIKFTINKGEYKDIFLDDDDFPFVIYSKAGGRINDIRTFQKSEMEINPIIKLHAFKLR